MMALEFHNVLYKCFHCSLKIKKKKTTWFIFICLVIAACAYLKIKMKIYEHLVIIKYHSLPSAPSHFFFFFSVSQRVHRIKFHFRFLCIPKRGPGKPKSSSTLH